MAKRRKDKVSGIIAAILCLPIIAIAALLIIHQNSDVNLDNIIKVSLKTPSAEESVTEAEKDLVFFTEFISSSLPIDTAMRDISEEEAVYIIFSDENESYSFKFYPSLDLSGCLIVSPKGDLYVPSTENARKLLLRSEFDYLYKNYFLPDLSILSGEKSFTVHPVHSTWSYYKPDGKLYSYTPAETSTGEERYTVTKGLENKLKFTPDDDVRPFDIKNMKFVAENGTEYEHIKDISELNLSFDTVIDVSFTAIWSSQNGAQAFGEAEYKFKLIYDIPAVLTLADKEYSIGDIIRIDADNLSESEYIELSCTLKNRGIDFDLVSEGKGVAFIPISNDTLEGDYLIELVTEVTTLSEKVHITGGTLAPFVPISGVSNEQYDTMLSPDKLKEFNTVISSLTETRPNVNYFPQGKIVLNSPINGAKPVYEFGQTFGIPAAQLSDSGTRIAEGQIFEVKEGTNVRAAQSGEVIFNGELAPTGKTVIIYHGFGIYSYYYHLESVNEDIIRGMAVSNSQIIGTAGMSGFTNGKTVLHYAVSIDGIFVNPQSVNFVQ